MYKIGEQVTIKPITTPLFIAMNKCLNDRDFIIGIISAYYNDYENQWHCREPMFSIYSYRDQRYYHDIYFSEVLINKCNSLDLLIYG